MTLAQNGRKTIQSVKVRVHPFKKIKNDVILELRYALKNYVILELRARLNRLKAVTFDVVILFENYLICSVFFNYYFNIFNLKLPSY